MFLATGFTDLRRGIDGLAAIAQQQFELDPFTNTLFLFCSRRWNRIKALYNEAECWDDAGQKPAAKAEKKPRKRRSSGSVQDIIPEGTPVEVVEHRLPEEERICGVCGSEMVEIGKEIRRTLQMEPPRFWVREDRYYLLKSLSYISRLSDIYNTKPDTI